MIYVTKFLQISLYKTVIKFRKNGKNTIYLKVWKDIADFVRPKINREPKKYRIIHC